MPLDRLHGHEEYDPAKVDRLVQELRRTGEFTEPIWVSRGSFVILNGHHRVEALRRLGARRAAAWILDYETDSVALERWRPGPPIRKGEVLERARRGELYPPKTTRHTVRLELPPRRVPLAELLL